MNFGSTRQSRVGIAPGLECGELKLPVTRNRPLAVPMPSRQRVGQRGVHFAHDGAQDDSRVWDAPYRRDPPRLDLTYIQLEEPAALIGPSQVCLADQTVQARCRHGDVRLAVSSKSIYSSFTTCTVTSAVTSLCNRTGILNSPSCLIGSSISTFRRSIVKFF